MEHYNHLDIHNEYSYLEVDCKWKIQTPSGSRIQLQFHLFRITDTGNNLELEDRHSSSIDYVGTFPLSSHKYFFPKLTSGDLVIYRSNPGPQGPIVPTNLRLGDAIAQAEQRHSMMP
uniref:CUB domain-containing protein n=1 Tax=Meloidogyne incognita TaxID=6306 RepID=A0A914LJ12_MELIC